MGTARRSTLAGSAGRKATGKTGKTWRAGADGGRRFGDGCEFADTGGFRGPQVGRVLVVCRANYVRNDCAWRAQPKMAAATIFLSFAKNVYTTRCRFLQPPPAAQGPDRGGAGIGDGRGYRGAERFAGRRRSAGSRIDREGT